MTSPVNLNSPSSTGIISEPEPEPARDRTVIVDVPKDSRLEMLLCIWESAKEKQDAAEAAYDEVKSGILAELQGAYPDKDIKAYDIAGGPMWPAMTYTYSETPYLPAPKIREFLPPVYEAFKQYRKGWTLRKKGKR